MERDILVTEVLLLLHQLLSVVDLYTRVPHSSSTVYLFIIRLFSTGKLLYGSICALAARDETVHSDTYVAIFSNVRESLLGRFS